MCVGGGGCLGIKPAPDRTTTPACVCPISSRTFLQLCEVNADPDLEDLSFFLGSTCAVSPKVFSLDYAAQNADCAESCAKRMKWGSVWHEVENAARKRSCEFSEFGDLTRAESTNAPCWINTTATHYRLE